MVSWTPISLCTVACASVWVCVGALRGTISNVVWVSGRRRTMVVEWRVVAARP